MSNSSGSRWKHTEQTVIRVRINLVDSFYLLCRTYSAQQHYVDDTTTINSAHDRSFPPNTPDAQEAEGDIQQLTPTPENNTQGL